MSIYERFFCWMLVAAVGTGLHFMGAKAESVTVLTGLTGALMRHVIGSVGGIKPAVPPMENGNVTK